MAATVRLLSSGAWPTPGTVASSGVRVRFTTSAFAEAEADSKSLSSPRTISSGALSSFWNSGHRFKRGAAVVTLLNGAAIAIRNRRRLRAPPLWPRAAPARTSSSWRSRRARRRTSAIISAASSQSRQRIGLPT